MRARCLSFHASYRCRHAGECCRAGWDVEVEPQIAEAVTSGRILPVISTDRPFEPLPDSGHLGPARTASGECTFHQHDRCALHACGSEDMLPSACRHFPRVFLRDGRGLLLTLSHFCPTAAALLMDAGPVEVVDAPSALMLAEPIEGLDARDALPPLVHPGLLADIEGYDAWERAVVRTFVQSADAESAFARIERATEGVRRWTPGGEPLAAAVREAFATADDGARDDPPLSKPFEIVRELTGPHPLMEVPAGFPGAWERIRRDDSARMAPTIGRYLAASAYGNWIAYRGQGLRSVVAWLRACYDVLRVQLVRGGSERDSDVPLDLLEPIRMADYIMVHTVDSLAFGRAAAALER